MAKLHVLIGKICAHILLPVFVCFSCILFTWFFFFFFFLSCFFVFCFYKVSRETWHSCLSSVSLFCSLALFLIFSSVSRLNCSLTSILIALFCTSTVISPVRVGNQEVPSHASDALNSITLTPTPPHAHTHTHIHTHTLTHSPSLSHTHSHTLTHLFCFLQSGQMPQVLLGSPVVHNLHLCLLVGWQWLLLCVGLICQVSVCIKQDFGVHRSQCLLPMLPWLVVQLCSLVLKIRSRAALASLPAS